MPPRTPRRILIDDWHRRLLDALEARYDIAVQRNYKTQGPLRQAIESLRRSKKAIHVQKGGNNKGLIRGIPNNINASVLQLMYRIIKGEEPVIPAGYDHDFGNNNNITGGNNNRRVDDVSQDAAFKRRRYRDSAYALLAGLWEKYDGSMGREVGTEEWKRRASRYCDYEMDYDYRTRQHGAFKAKAQLVANGYVVERSDGGYYHRSKHYYLTDRGAKLCYLLFNDKFHPSKGDYPLVQPARRFTREEIFSNNNQHNQNNTNNNYNNFDRDDHNIIDDFEPPNDKFYANNTLTNRSNHQTPLQLTTIHRDGNDITHKEFDDIYNHDFHNILDHDNNHQTAINEGTRIRRIRLLKMDPHCKEKIIQLMSMGVEEDDAWVLYEHGATDEAPPTPLRKNASGNIEKSSSYQNNRIIVLEETEGWKTPQQHRTHSCFVDLTPSARDTRPSQPGVDIDATTDEEEMALIAAIEASEQEQALLEKQQLKASEEFQLQAVLTVSKIEEKIRLLEAQVGTKMHKTNGSSANQTQQVQSTTMNNLMSSSNCIDLTPTERKVPCHKKSSTNKNNFSNSSWYEDEPVTTIDLSEYDENGFAYHRPDYSGIDEFVIVVEDDDVDVKCSFNDADENMDDKNSNSINNSSSNSRFNHNNCSSKDTPHVAQKFSSFVAGFMGDRNILSEDIYDFDSFHDNFLKKKTTSTAENNMNNSSSNSYSAIKTKVKSKAIVVSAKEYMGKESQGSSNCLDLTDSYPVENSTDGPSSHQSSRLNSHSNSRNVSPRVNRTQVSSSTSHYKSDYINVNRDKHKIESIDLYTSQNGLNDVQIQTPVHVNKYNNSISGNIGSSGSATHIIDTISRRTSMKHGVFENLVENSMDLTDSQPLCGGEIVPDLDTYINELETLQKDRGNNLEITPTMAQRRRSRSGSGSTVTSTNSTSKNQMNITNKKHALTVIFEDIEEENVHTHDGDKTFVITIDAKDSADVNKKNAEIIDITSQNINEDALRFSNYRTHNTMVEIMNLSESLPENTSEINVACDYHRANSSVSKKRRFSEVSVASEPIDLEQEGESDRKDNEIDCLESVSKRRALEGFMSDGRNEGGNGIANSSSSSNNSPRKPSVFATLFAKHQQQLQSSPAISHVATHNNLIFSINKSNDSIITCNSVNALNHTQDAPTNGNNNIPTKVYPPNFATQWQRVYDSTDVAIDNIADTSSIVLVVDQRERSKNTYYRDMITTMAHTLQRYSSLMSDNNGHVGDENVGLREMKLTLGDFCFALETPRLLSSVPHNTARTKFASKTNAKTNNRMNIESEEDDDEGFNEEETVLYHLGVSIERKTLNDIISRSASAKEYTKYTGRFQKSTPNKQTHHHSIDNMAVSEKDAPHFKQEKHLRNSGFVDNYLLLEGDFLALFSDNDRRRFMYRPMVSSTNSDKDLQKKDTLNDGEDLMRYLAGLLVRNTSGFIISSSHDTTANSVQSVAHQVTILFSLDVKFTCVLLAAMGTVLAQNNKHLHTNNNADPDRNIISYPPLQTVSRHWYWTRVRDRLVHLQQLISDYNNSRGSGDNSHVIIGKNMFDKLIRRFGENAALYDTLSLCHRNSTRSSYHAELLCHRLSAAAANPLSNSNNDNDSFVDNSLHDNSFSSNYNSNSTSSRGETEDWHESAAVAHCIFQANNHHNHANNIIVHENNIRQLRETCGRTTFVGMSEGCSERCDHLKGFPAHFHPFHISRTDNHRRTMDNNQNVDNDRDALVSWNEIVVRETCKVDDNAVGKNHSVVRASAPIFTVVLPGHCVVAALGMAYDQLSSSSARQRREEVSPVTVTQRAMTLIDEDWLPASLKERMASYHYRTHCCARDTNDDTAVSRTAPAVTLVYLAENLGHGRSNTGAVGRLHNALVKHNHQNDSNGHKNDFIYLNQRMTSSQRRKSGQSGVADEEENTFDVLSMGRVSSAAAQYISDRAIWLVALMSAQCMLSTSSSKSSNHSRNSSGDFEIDETDHIDVHKKLPRHGIIRQWWPVSDSNGVCPAETVVAFILHEMQEQALLPYSY